MPKSYKFTQAQIEELTVTRKKNKNKNVDRRLETLLMRAANISRIAVSEKIGFCTQYITDLTANYRNYSVAISLFIESSEKSFKLE